MIRLATPNDTLAGAWPAKRSARRGAFHAPSLRAAYRWVFFIA
jgi:hypothetical protein